MRRFFLSVKPCLQYWRSYIETLKEYLRALWAKSEAYYTHFMCIVKELFQCVVFELFRSWKMASTISRHYYFISFIVTGKILVNSSGKAVSYMQQYSVNTGCLREFVLKLDVLSECSFGSITLLTNITSWNSSKLTYIIHSKILQSEQYDICLIETNCIDNSIHVTC